VLVIRHKQDVVELLQGLCVFLNSAEAAAAVLAHRPSVQYRTSFPKISAKDINHLIDAARLDEATLCRLAKEYPK
jgi:hypothetical protein